MNAMWLLHINMMIGKPRWFTMINYGFLFHLMLKRINAWNIGLLVVFENMQITGKLSYPRNLPFSHGHVMGNLHKLWTFVLGITQPCWLTWETHVSPSFCNGKGGLGLTQHVLHNTACPSWLQYWGMFFIGFIGNAGIIYLVLMNRIEVSQHTYSWIKVGQPL